MIEALTVCQSIGWTLYAGPMLAFCIMAYTNNNFYKSFSHFGVGFGLALTLWIYSSIALQYLSDGHFYPNIKEALWIPAALLMWISNIKLEIWTLDPIRKNKSPALKQHIRSLRMHLTLHSLLIISVHILFILRSSPSF